jgi:hypothetical protein
MYSWTDPTDLSDYLARMFSLRAGVAVLVFFAILVTEMRFDWMEKLIGGYLVKTNAARPMTGPIWDKDRERLAARQVLDQLVTDRIATRRDARNAQTFDELIQAVSDGGGVMISPAQFRKMYLEMPSAVGRDIISPYELLSLLARPDWERTFVERTGQKLTMIMLDAGNRVVHTLVADIDLITHALTASASPGRLEDLSGLALAIYPADRFFDSLMFMSDGVREQIVMNPKALIASTGKITRVGIGRESHDGRIDLFFEVAAPDQQWETRRLEGMEWAVRQLFAVPASDAPDETPVTETGHSGDAE